MENSYKDIKSPAFLKSAPCLSVPQEKHHGRKPKYMCEADGGYTDREGKTCPSWSYWWHLGVAVRNVGQNKNVAHKELCYTISSVLQGLLFVFWLWKGQRQWCLSRHFEGIGHPLPSWWAGSKCCTSKNRSSSACSSQPQTAAFPLIFSLKDQNQKNLVTVSPLGCGAWAPELQLVLVLPQEGGWHQPMVRGCRKRVKRRAPALICSFPPLSLSTFWIVPLLLFQCSTSCDCGRVLSKVKDNRPLMHPAGLTHCLFPEICAATYLPAVAHYLLFIMP